MLKKLRSTNRSYKTSTSDILQKQPNSHCLVFQFKTSHLYSTGFAQIKPGCSNIPRGENDELDRLSGYWNHLIPEFNSIDITGRNIKLRPSNQMQPSDSVRCRTAERSTSIHTSRLCKRSIKERTLDCAANFNRWKEREFISSLMF